MESLGGLRVLFGDAIFDFSELGLGGSWCGGIGGELGNVAGVEVGWSVGRCRVSGGGDWRDGGLEGGVARGGACFADCVGGQGVCGEL